MYSSADQASPLDEEVLSNIESTWAPASKQFPLLNMGKEVKVVTAIYDNRKFFIKKSKSYIVKEEEMLAMGSRRIQFFFNSWNSVCFICLFSFSFFC